MKSATSRWFAHIGFALLAATLACRLPGSSETDSDAAAGDATDGVADSAVAVAQVDCDGASLSATNAQLGERLTIEGLPDDVDVEVLMLAVEPTASGGRAEGGIVRQDEFGIFIYAPAHPDVFNGGDVTISVYAGETICLEQGVTIEAIDAAPGAFASYVSALNEYIAWQREIAGVTREQLLADDLSELPPQLIPLAIVQHSIDGPDYGDSMDRILDGTAESLQGQEIDLEVLDAVVAQLGLEENLRTKMQSQRDFFAEALSSHSGGMLASPAQQISLGNITSPAALAVALKAQQNCENQANDEVLQTVVGTVENALMSLPVIGTIAGVGVAKEHFIDNACVTLMPNSLSNFSAAVTARWFPLDWVGQPGAVSQVTLMAQGGQMDLKQAIGDAIGVAASAAGGKLTSSTKGALTASLTALATGICALKPECNQDTSTLGPFSYGPFDVNHSNWITVKSSNGVVSMVGQNPFTYEPTKQGIDPLRIETKPGSFAPAAPAMTSVAVFVGECHEAVTSVVPTEGAYIAVDDPFELSCQGGRGPSSLPVPGRTYNGSVSLNDETGCLLTVTATDVAITVARTAVDERSAQYHGVVDFGGFACGIAMSWDQAGQNFLGESNCFGNISGSTCGGGGSFKMSPQ